MIIVLTALIGVLLAGSAFFSGSETALFSISAATRQRWRREGTPRQQLVAKLMGDHHTTITAILTGNAFVNLLAAVALAHLLAALNQTYGWPEFVVSVVAAFAITGILLLVGEVSPKAIAYPNALWLAPLVAPAVAWLCRLLGPLIRFLKFCSGLLLRVISGTDRSRGISVAEYQSYTSLAHRQGVFTESEVRMFNKVFALRDLRVAQIMVPRPDVYSVDSGLTDGELLNEIRLARHRFLPVVNGELDKLQGVLDVRAFCLLPAARRKHWVHVCLSKPLYVPENARVHGVLTQLREAGQQLAFVVNEYGGVEGLVSAENIYEQLVGDLTDEFDQPFWRLAEIRPGHWRASGSIPLKHLAEQLHMELPETTAHTLGGLLAEQLEHLPDMGELWSWNDWEYVVRRTHRNRVVEVDILRVAPFLPPEEVAGD